MEKKKEDIILRDWLSFTSKKHTPQEIINALGLSDLPWQETKGARGYRDRYYFGCISIHYNGREDMGVWCEMSGQGCRNFEQFSKLPNKWDDLFKFITDNNLHVTRLDVAFDDHTGLLDIEQVANDIKCGNFISYMNFWEVICSSKGTSVQIGSPQSNTLIRIYDKAAERGYQDDTHWIRVELQLRDDRAQKFLDLNLTLGKAFAGVLMNYIRIVEPDEFDSNRSRWPTAGYWVTFLNGASRISVYTAPGADYNFKKLSRYVIDQIGNAISCLIDCVGVQDFLFMLNNRRCKKNPKYEDIVYQYHEMSAEWAEEVYKTYLRNEDEKRKKKRNTNFI